MLVECSWNSHCVGHFHLPGLPLNRRNYSHRDTRIQSYPGYPKPRLSETSVIRTQFRTWSLFKKYGILTKIAGSATELSTCVFVSCIHGQCRHTVLMVRPAYSVKCKGLQTRPSYILLCYNSMYIAGKVSFGLSEQFRLSEQPIKPLCPKVFG